VTDTENGSFETKPTYAIIGHVHAGEVTGTMSAMYFLDYILTNKDEEEIAELLKVTSFYCIPRPVPDGAEYWLTHPE